MSLQVTRKGQLLHVGKFREVFSSLIDQDEAFVGSSEDEQAFLHQLQNHSVDLKSRFSPLSFFLSLFVSAPDGASLRVPTHTLLSLHPLFDRLQLSLDDQRFVAPKDRIKQSIEMHLVCPPLLLLQTLPLCRTLPSPWCMKRDARTKDRSHKERRKVIFIIIFIIFFFLLLDFLCFLGNSC